METEYGFYYCITPRGAPLSDYLLHIMDDPNGVPLYHNSYPTETGARVAFDAWARAIYNVVGKQMSGQYP